MNTTPDARAQDPDVIIIGAGQAGLATAALLVRAGLHPLVLDEDARVGDQWRHRYDSLRLNTPARLDGLPGMPFPAPPQSYPTGRDMGDYLESYAHAMGVPVCTNTRVLRIDRDGGDDWLVSCRGAQFRAPTVVVATGGESNPSVPTFAPQLDPGIRQIHSSVYRDPSQLLPGPVLVVGASQSGADLAIEAVAAGHETWLSGHIRSETPFEFDSRRARLALPVLWFMANHVFTLRTPIGRRMRPAIRAGGAPLVRVRSVDLDAAGVHRVPARTVGVSDGRPMLDDGQVLDVTNVLWCTGFRQDFGFIHPSVVDDAGWPTEDRGVVASAPGLFFVGLIFQSGFYSMLVGGVGRDAVLIAEHIVRRQRARSATATGQSTLVR